MKKLLNVAFVSAIIFVSLSFSVQAGDDLFNPHQSSDDVVLPMPCGYKMAFRKVYTSDNKASKLSYFEFNDGDTNSKNQLTQGKYKCRVQGSFHDQNGYYMLVSKYELMSAQYLALTTDKCPTNLDKKAILPAVNLTYLDFANAAAKYSFFLQKQKDVPGNGSQKAYASLPANCEWAFAMRGGLKVPKDVLESTSGSFKDGIEKYAWFNSSVSSNGNLQRPGLLKPNPLGLYDMLGNAMELMDDRFTVQVGDESLGQRGGFTVRGGSFLTSKDQLNSATRSEKPLFDSKGNPTHSRDLGTRFVLGLPVIGSIKEVKELNQELSQSKLKTQDNLKSANLSKSGKSQNKVSAQAQNLSKNKPLVEPELLDDTHGQDTQYNQKKPKQQKPQDTNLEAKSLNTQKLKKKHQSGSLKVNQGSKQAQKTYDDNSFGNIIDNDDITAAAGGIDTSNIEIDGEIADVSEDDAFVFHGKTLNVVDLYQRASNQNKGSQYRKSRVVNEISAQYAPYYFHETVWMCGELAQVKVLNNMTLLNLDDKYPQQNLTIMLRGKAVDSVESEYGNLNSKLGHKICAFGEVVDYKDNFEIIIDDARDLEVK